jgi:NAD-dependent dihydropyrimidine dehydrogenase PreA subunit
MKAKRKIVEFDEELCDGCGQCIPACAEGAIQIINGKARLVSESYCDGLGACLKECPQGAIRIIEREAEVFDQEAAEDFLKEKKYDEKTAEIQLPCGCPSSRVQTFNLSCMKTNQPHSQVGITSSLSHWPVQIELVPATAPFLKSANLLVAADCTPVAYPDFHRDFLKGRVVLIGCPKFDNVQEYIKKFADIFRMADIQSVTVLDMEVPCCSVLPVIVRKGMEIAKKEVPIEEVVISTHGKILKRVECVALMDKELR